LNRGKVFFYLVGEGRKHVISKEIEDAKNNVFGMQKINVRENEKPRGERNVLLKNFKKNKQDCKNYGKISTKKKSTGKKNPTAFISETP